MSRKRVLNESESEIFRSEAVQKLDRIKEYPPLVFSAEVVHIVNSKIRQLSRRNSHLGSVLFSRWASLNINHVFANRSKSSGGRLVVNIGCIIQEWISRRAPLARYLPVCDL